MIPVTSLSTPECHREDYPNLDEMLRWNVSTTSTYLLCDA